MKPDASARVRYRRTALFASTVAVAWLAACSTVPPPREQIAVGRAAVERASGPAAADAPVELAAAREKMERANVAMANKDYPLARQLAEQAEADATLAEAQSRSARSERALTEVRESIRQLREQTASPQ
jgi:hypothetical protein